MVYDVSEELCIYNHILTDEVDGVGLELDKSAGKLEFGKAIPLDVHKITALPKACKSGSLNTFRDTGYEFDARAVMKVMFRHFSAHYAFTVQKNIDWQTMESQWLERVNEKTDADELVQIISEFLATIRDGHAILVDKNLNRLAHYPPRKPELEKRLQKILATHSEFMHISDVYRFVYRNWIRNVESYFDEQFEPQSFYKNFSFAKLNGNIAYLRIESFDEHNTKEVMSKLTPMIVDSAGLIIDLRDSSGGNDPVALEIASYFTDKKVRVGDKRFKTGTGMSKVNDVVLHPADARAYTDKIVVITSQQTPSAAELFVLAIRARAGAILIGENSNGAFSDALTKTLPNGWIITLSNEEFLDHQGMSFEFTGIPVDKYFEFPSVYDVENKKDSALEYAIEWLQVR